MIRQQTFASWSKTRPTFSDIFAHVACLNQLEHDQSKGDKLRQEDFVSLDEADDEFGKHSLERSNEAEEEEEEEKETEDKRQLDTISVSSLQGPNATRIKVPYRHVIEIQKVDDRTRGSKVKDGATQGRLLHQTVGSAAIETSSSEMSFQEDIERLSNRLASINNRASHRASGQQGRHFEYKTLEADIDPMACKSVKQVVSTYNARLEQNSPFQTSSNNFTQIVSTNGEPIQDYSPSEYYVKYRATPVLVDESNLLTGGKNNNEEDDRSSCCSLQSSRTYKIRTIELDESEQRRNKTNETQADEVEDRNEVVEFDENGNSRRPAAWIYDPRDGSSTAIIPPKRPETPRVDSKTEELVQSRGGRSYYLEILDSDRNKTEAPRERPALGSMDSLYSRWNSHGALNTGASSQMQSSPVSRPAFQYRPLTPAKTPAKSLHRSTKQLNTLIAQQEQNRDKFGQLLTKQQSPRRQLPFGGPISNLGDKSKSSSCLLTVTKPSKYSIYGGFRRPDETKKPVPRLSYSRAIGPRSQRGETQSKTPSRYLKMR